MNKAKEEVFDFEKYKKTKEYKIAINNSGTRLRKTIFYNPRKREKLKKNVLELQKISLRQLESQKQPRTYSDLKSNSLTDAFLNLADKFLKRIKEGEIYERERELADCRYELLKHQTKKSVVFKTSYTRVRNEKKERGYLFIRAGLPTKKQRRKAVFIKGKFNTLDYKKIDEGRFIQKLIDYDLVKYWFTGKKKRFKFLYKGFHTGKNEGFFSQI